MITMHFDVFISVLSVMYRLLMYVFPYHYSALMALHIVLHVDTVLIAVALMIMTVLGPSPGPGRHILPPSSFLFLPLSFFFNPLLQSSINPCHGLLPLSTLVLLPILYISI